jgi:DNA uptake protein ComE-like DNA-binding protein
MTCVPPISALRNRCSRVRTAAPIVPQRRQSRWHGLSHGRPPRSGGVPAIRRHGRRAFATVLALWVVALAVVVIAGVQATGFRQSVAGREAMARARAHWAARGGVEMMIARLAYNTETPDQYDAFRVVDDMAAAATGELDGARYIIAHTAPDGRTLPGPLDAHSRFNINMMTAADLMLLPGMTEDVADAVLDWIDEDDDVRPFGAEIGQYLSLPFPYEPRNAPIRSPMEVELIYGVLPEFVRGQDLNLNNLLDPEEDSGGRFDAGWSGIVTPYSLGGGLTASGQERVDLALATPQELAQRFAVEPDQAEVMIAHAAQPDADMTDFLTRSLTQMLRDQNPGVPSRQLPSIRALTDEQLGLLLDEAGIGLAEPAGPPPGRINLNTVPREVLEYIDGLDPAVADVLIFERDTRAGGLTSLIDLLENPLFSRQRLAQLYPLFDVRSNVYIVTSRGRDSRTGMEVEMIAVLDRSTLPVVIRELQIR